MLLPFIIGRKHLTRDEMKQGLILAFWGGSGMALQADALAYTDASTSAFLTQAYCIILPLWACLRLRKRPTTRVIISTLMVVIGGAILSGLRVDHLKLGRGEIETLCAAFLFTFQILALEDSRFGRNRGLPVTFVMFVGITILLLPPTLLAAPNLATCFTVGTSMQTFVLIGSLALFSSLGAHLIMNIWQPRVSATEAGLIYTMEPVFTALFVLFLPALLGAFIGSRYDNETMSSTLVTGGSLILAANLLMQWKRPPHMPPVGPIP